jgi:RimJ/RimL family protein N-acetyltransferase
MILREIYAAGSDQNWWDLKPAEQDRWRAYVREHIGDPNVVGFPFVIEEGGGDIPGKYVIHYREYLLNEKGQKYLLPDKSAPAMRTRWVTTDAAPPGM